MGISTLQTLEDVFLKLSEEEELAGQQRANRVVAAIVSLFPSMQYVSFIMSLFYRIILALSLMRGPLSSMAN